MLGRIDVGHPAAEDRHGAEGQGALVGGPVDAARQAGDHDLPRLAQVRGQAPGEPLAGGRGDARADHGHRRSVEKLGAAQRPEHRRRRVQRRERLGEVGLAGADEPRAHLRAGRQLGLDLSLGGDLQPRCAPAASGEVGQGGQGASGLSEPRQQLIEGDGADVLRAREPQPGQALAIGERPAHAAGSGAASFFFSPIRGSSPLRRRRMLSMCRM